MREDQVGATAPPELPPTTTDLLASASSASSAPALAVTASPATPTPVLTAPSGTDPEEVLEGGAYPATPRLPVLLHRAVVRGMLVFLLIAMMLGCLAGALWNLVVDLPAYHVDSAGNATTSERGLTAVFASDAWFSIFGLALGLTLGILAWHWFRRIGWPVVLLAMGTATVAGLMCWWVGVLMGPHNFSRRIAQASPGDLVPIDFKLHAWSALLVWPFFATIPVLLRASLGADEQVATRRCRSRKTVKAAKLPEPSVTEEEPSTPVPPPAA
ncbi:hypothetical protein EDD41_0185 [Luteococcus japonicus]|uniref:DUF2567 domain-containing protein n=1 Tax=Luteococcus japonicus TaxID=33984 RepID=A0A3N1ZSH7_9ACTN|nr:MULTISPECIES: hypothetical protein [Luteococcus]MDN5564350.1 hypothetical protein [Luteococcus sp.]ROR53062.1 hypothetical protein EDD41_0185 [Luteococcus japonicus]